LNDTGEYLWSLLDTHITAADLARNLTVAFETTAGRAHSDVDLFLAALRDIGAVREADRRRTGVSAMQMSMNRFEERLGARARRTRQAVVVSVRDHAAL
jgi:hypothetical protein